MWSRSDVLSAVALGISICGWIVAYRFNVRASKAVHHRNLLSGAVSHVSEAIWSFQDWCSDVNGRVLGLEADRDISWHLGAPEIRTKGLRDLRRTGTTDARQFLWIRSLETYEQFFPSTREVRVELLGMVRQAVQELTAILNGAELGPLDTARLQPLSERFGDLMALSWDMRVCTQNIAFADITGMRITERQPTVPKSFVLRSNRDGTLVITQT